MTKPFFGYQMPNLTFPDLDAGCAGFTFNDTVLPIAESIALAGELLRLVS